MSATCQAAFLLLALGYITDMQIYGKNLPSPPNEIDVYYVTSYQCLEGPDSSTMTGVLTSRDFVSGPVRIPR